MKIYFILLTVLFLFTLLNLFIGINKDNKDYYYNDDESNINNYLNSLTSTSVNLSDTKIILFDGDTLEFNELKTNSLFYYFSASECSSCVNENIYNLISMAKKRTTNFYIICSNDGLPFLKYSTKNQKYNNIHFGLLIDNQNIEKSFYVLKLENEAYSNLYYPVKGMFQYTKKYVEYVVAIIP
jgi:hypothetical protein